MAKVNLAPWPLGQDNVHDEYADVFQYSPDRPLRLIEAVNVDLDDEGKASRRSGTAEVLAGTAYKNLVSCAGLLLAQDNGSILRVTPGSPFTSTPLVAGLSTSLKCHFVEFGGDCYWTNTEESGKITAAGAATHWGLGVPPSPTLGTTTGDLPAGRYRVAATYVDANGMESGALKASSVVTDGTDDITATLVVGDSNATHVNFYISPADQEELFFCQQVAVGALPATLINERVSTRPLRTQHLRGPVPGAGLFKYKGYLLTWRDNWIFRSRGHTPALFHTREILGFPWDIKQALGLKDGFYVATERMLYWIEGTAPDEWRPIQKDSASYAKGGIILNGSKIPALQTSEQVALFASSDGLVAGLPGGQIQHLTKDRLTLATTPAEATIMYRDSGDLQQLLLLLS